MKLSPLFLVALPLICLSAQPPTLDQIVAKNLDALGGGAALKALQTVTIEAKMVVQSGMQEMPVKMTIKRPHFMRNEMRVQGQTIVMAYDGVKAWMINPLLGSAEAREVPANMAGQVTQNADVESVVGSLAGFRDSGHTLELLGPDTVADKPVYKVKITRKSGEWQTYFLDAATWLPLKTTSTITQAGQQKEVETYASDFRQVHGLRLAHATEQRVNGASVVKMTIEKYLINAPVDDAIFRMPAPAAKPAAEKKN